MSSSRSSQTGKFWHIAVVNGEAKVFGNGAVLKSSKGVEYECLLEISTACAPKPASGSKGASEKMIQVG